jgi:hypothetical protein
MDMPPAWSQACVCGRTFSAPHTYTHHMRTCPQTKKRLSSALENAREVLQEKKRRKMEDMIQREALLVDTSNHPVIDSPSSLTDLEVLLPTPGHQQVRSESPSTYWRFLCSSSDPRDTLRRISRSRSTFSRTEGATTKSPIAKALS